MCSASALPSARSAASHGDGVVRISACSRLTNVAPSFRNSSMVLPGTQVERLIKAADVSDVHRGAHDAAKTRPVETAAEHEGGFARDPADEGLAEEQAEVRLRALQRGNTSGR